MRRQGRPDQRDLDPALPDFLWNGYRADVVALAALTVAAALGHAGLIVVVAWGIASADFGAFLARHALIAALAVVLVLALKAGAAAGAARLAERVVSDLRTRLTGRLAATGLMTVRAVGEARLQSALSADADSVAAGVTAAAIIAQAVVLILGCFAALLVVDVNAAAIPVVIVALAAVVTKARGARVERGMHRALAVEDALARRIDALFTAAADLRLNARRRRDFEAAGLWPAVRGCERVRFAAAQDSLDQVMIFFGAVFLLTTSGFVLASLGFGLTAVFVVAVLFQLFDRLEFTILNNPVMDYANAALTRLAALERELVPEPKATAPPRRSVGTLSFEGVCYRYPSAEGDGFAVGPLDFTIEGGDIVLVSGGNGAGKSTVMRLLCGLLRPTEGVIRLNGRPVAPQNLSALFSAVFTDFHLFRRPYGLDPEAAREVGLWIERLGLGGKVSFDGESFGPLALSRGQRKRLALAVTLAERRPILLLDEWTADQSPEFRERFFSYLLPAFRAEGRTVIAVTHDERYFHAGDVHVRIEAGRIASVTRPAAVGGE